MLDVLCDRLSAAVFYVGFAWYDPTMAVPVGIYLAEFLVLDMFLSIAFLAWPVSSPNYFYVVDRRLWRWNWSKPGKAAQLRAVRRRPGGHQEPGLDERRRPLRCSSLKVVSLRLADAPRSADSRPRHPPADAAADRVRWRPERAPGLPRRRHRQQGRQPPVTSTPPDGPPSRPTGGASASSAATSTRSTWVTSG